MLYPKYTPTVFSLDDVLYINYAFIYRVLNSQFLFFCFDRDSYRFTFSNYIMYIVLITYIRI